MKRLLLNLVLFSLIFACSTRRQMEKTISYGNYDHAITDAIGKLKINKDRKGKQDIILLLEEAFNKATDRDLDNISLLKKDNNPETYLHIFNAYVNLDNRQERIKPLLPLYVKGREINLNFNDYSNEIIDYKNSASLQLYSTAVPLLNAENKLDIRAAYDMLREIEAINPNYKDVRQLMQVAHQRGTDYILVSINNETQQVIPSRLEDDLLNFDTYGLNKFWSVYHANKVNDVDYNYSMHLNLKRINISPERIKERQIVREKEIVDGWKYKLDDKGNVAKDSLGNDIKVDKIVKVKCRLLEVKQIKSSQVIADVAYVDLGSKQLIDSFPIDSQFVFENVFATTRGDKRALSKNERQLLNNRRVPFPSNEQMVYDTGEDLKLQLKDIINSYTIR